MENYCATKQMFLPLDSFISKQQAKNAGLYVPCWTHGAWTLPVLVKSPLKISLLQSAPIQGDAPTEMNANLKNQGMLLK